MNFRHAALPLALLLALPTIATARGLQPKDLATLDRYSSPTLSPDGKQLVFASNRGGTAAGETNLFVVDWVE